MKLETFSYTIRTGWSVQPFPDLDSDRTLVIVFSAPEFVDTPEPIEALVQAYPSSHVIGCSSSGEIFDAKISDGSMAVGVLQFEYSSVASTAAPVQSADESYEAGRTLAKELARPDLRAVLVLSDGLSVNGSELVRGINSVLPRAVVVTGGLAGDADRFARTWVLERGRPASGLVSAAGLYGERVVVGHGSKGGWDIFGPERLVTRSDHNVLYELDGRPALELYKEYLGERASGLPATALLFPLALRSDSTGDDSVVRTILAVDEDKQSMTFAGDIPEGWQAQLMRANFDRLVDGASGAALATRDACKDGQPTLAVAISCVGRRLVLGERTEEETEATLEVLPEGTQQIGFYSYGEISPLTNGRCDLHNQTMTLTTIRER
ncbi:MAG: FIST N-terminal domain-containing protein [Dehalococcoidia bacterium]